MKLLAIAAVGVLALALGACSHMGQGMHPMHEGGRMDGHRTQERTCPADHAGDPASAHEHADGAENERPAPAQPQ